MTMTYTTTSVSVKITVATSAPQFTFWRIRVWKYSLDKAKLEMDERSPQIGFPTQEYEVTGLEPGRRYKVEVAPRTIAGDFAPVLGVTKGDGSINGLSTTCGCSTESTGSAVDFVSRQVCSYVGRAVS